jgi:putative ABC transport system permease protein
LKLHNISFNNLRRRRLKMVFLVTGLLIGIATIVTLMSITESMTRDIEERLDRFGANIIMVPDSKNLALSYGGINVGGVNYQINEIEASRLGDIRTIKNNKNIGTVAPKILGPVTVGENTVLLMGVDFEAEYNIKTWWRFAGEYPQTPQDLLLGSEAARVLGLDSGDSLELGAREFRVTGVLQPTGAADDNAIIGDLQTVQAVLGKPGKVSMVEIAAFCGGCPISEMVLQIAEKFPDTKVTALQQAVMSKMQSIEMFKSFSYGIAGLVIFVGSLLVFVTMMGSVNERTREIGIFRAIGFRRGHVMQIILLEALVVGLIGGLLGFFIGNAAAWAAIPLVMEGGTFAGINAQLGGMSLLLAVALSLLASLYPAHKASRLDPSQALRAL